MVVSRTKVVGRSKGTKPSSFTGKREGPGSSLFELAPGALDHVKLRYK